MDKVSPEKTIKISHKHKFVEPWMTHGIEVASRKIIKLYKKSINGNATEDDITKYGEYRNHYNKLKRTAQLIYYTNKVKGCKNKTKDLWKLINKVIGKVKNRGSIISHITIDGLKKYNPK